MLMGRAPRSAFSVARMQRMFQSLGPGILFAASAIGTSHLVQSTRAGADYGLWMIWVLLAIFIVKYPFFEFAPRYTVAARESIVSGYLRIGRWALALFLTASLLTMFTTVAAVTLFTASLAAVMVPIGVPVEVWSAIILVLVSALLIAGRYAVMDKVVKAMVLILFMATFFAVGIVFGRPVPPEATHWWPQSIDPVMVAFTVALIGWMPIGLEISVFHSAWTMSRAKETGRLPTFREARWDFLIGYGACLVLAVMFLLLGVFVFFGHDGVFTAGTGVFARALFGAYQDIFGGWIAMVVKVAALAAMLSTVIALTDAYPRTWRLAAEALAPEMERFHGLLYLVLIVILCLGGFLIIIWFSADLPVLIDLAMTISFVGAPVIACLNFRAVHLSHVDPALRPGPAMRLYAAICLILLTALALGYLCWRFL